MSVEPSPDQGREDDEGHGGDAALIAARQAADNGNRADLNDVIAAFGFDRAELEAELEAERDG